MGAVHNSLGKMAADAGYPLLLVEAAGYRVAPANIQRSVAGETVIIPIAEHGLKSGVLEGSGMGRERPLLILSDMTGTAFVGPGAMAVIRGQSGKTVKGCAAGHGKQAYCKRYVGIQIVFQHINSQQKVTVIQRVEPLNQSEQRA